MSRQQIVIRLNYHTDNILFGKEDELALLVYLREEMTALITREEMTAVTFKDAYIGNSYIGVEADNE